MTVNRVCGSGAQAIASAATEIAAGQAECFVVGGMENMDRALISIPMGAGATAWARCNCSTAC